MADGSRNQAKPMGQSQRDAAFSNIFGSAPPPGRGQSNRSYPYSSTPPPPQPQQPYQQHAMSPISRTATAPPNAPSHQQQGYNDRAMSFSQMDSYEHIQQQQYYQKDSPNRTITQSPRPPSNNSNSRLQNRPLPPGQSNYSQSPRPYGGEGVLRTKLSNENSLSAGFDFSNNNLYASPPPPPPQMRHGPNRLPPHFVQRQPVRTGSPGLSQQQQLQFNNQHSPQRLRDSASPSPHQIHQSHQLPPQQNLYDPQHQNSGPVQFPGAIPMSRTPQPRSVSTPVHQNLPQSHSHNNLSHSNTFSNFNNIHNHNPQHGQGRYSSIPEGSIGINQAAAGMRSMSMTASSARMANAPYDRDSHRSQTMTLSGRVIPRRQGPEANPLSGTDSPNSLNNSSRNSKSSPSVSTLVNSTSDASQRSHSMSSHASELDHHASFQSMTSHSTILTTSRRTPLVYPAMLSRVADTFRQRINLGVRIKDELTYNDAFTGAEAVDVIAYIIKTTDRNLALLLGRALDAQKFFHDVTYDHRLRDTSNELYQFNEMVVDGQSNENNNMGSATVPVNGVFTLLTECYSPTCTRDQLCYSIACPRRLEQQARLNMKPQSVLKRADSRLSLHGDDEKEQKLWINTVSKETADTVSEKEQKRQEVICELIYTERDFVKDLEYLRDFWIKPLRVSNIIPDTRREKFIRAVFGLILDVHAVNVKLAEALTKRQQQAPIVRQVGDVMLEHIPKFEPFIRYGAQQVYAKYEFEREKSVNPAFAKFVDETERLKESRKLELNGYLTKPTTRLARYPLLLDAVLKATDETNPDKENLPKARTLVREFLTKVNVESGKAENRLQLMQLNQNLMFRPGERVDLKLTDENRQIIFKGSFKKRTQDKENQGDVQCYLFDNSLLFVRVKIVNKREQLKVHRKPIPLELLVITESDEAPAKGLGGKRAPTATLIAKTQPTAKETAQNKYPILFQHLGRRGYDLVLYSSTFIGRKKWVEHIMSQKKVLIEKADVYTQQILMKGFFDGSNRVNCLTPLDGGRKLLYGTDNGIFLSDLKTTPTGRMVSKPQMVIKISTITQIDVIEEYNMLLALSDKTLYSWPLDCLESTEPTGNERRARKIMGHINFYKVGLCLGRILVCTAKSGSMNSTVRVLEPVDPNPRGRRQPALRKLLASQNEGLKVFKEFGIPSEIISISFLTSNLCVGCAKGFEIVSLETLESQSLLDPADTSLDFVIRREALKPMAIYRLNKDFLLNYADFSFFVNRNGWRSRPEWMIHWEGLPQGFSLSYPYLIAFEPNFVEIRHIDTAELVRVITGENIRFLHENTREIVYVYEDENGFDVVVSLDFWEKGKSNNSAAAGGSGTKTGTITELSSSNSAK